MENIDNNFIQNPDGAQSYERAKWEVEMLRDFTGEERFEKLSSRLESRTNRMVLALEDVFHPHNASACIRSAEAFGVQEIHAVQSRCQFSPSHKIVRGTDQWVDIKRWKSTPELVEHLRSRGYRIVVTAPRENGSTLESFDAQGTPFAIFMGTEKTGISDWLMQEADDSIFIPMTGFAESLNISVSAAIITQELTRRIRLMPPHKWQLSDSDKTIVLSDWLRKSIKNSEEILERLAEKQNI